MPTIEILGQRLDFVSTVIILSLLGWIISTAIGLWVAYYLMKAAIRDGIKESGLVSSWGSVIALQRERDRARDLPDMRAD